MFPKRGFHNHPPYRGQKLVMINYSYTINLLGTPRQEMLYELGLNSEEITFILSLRRREELLGLDC